ncbi:MAG: TIGR03617 family F420-dependent LLM class oxidoreductase [Anaerolineales bacterium]
MGLNDMLLDAALPPVPLPAVPHIAIEAERLGFNTLWSSETTHDPFLPLAVAAEHTQKLNFGTAVAVSFARSPATIAYTAWDLAQSSNGRFSLGLGTQVKAHIERRFGMPWPESPVTKLRDQIAAMRALWHTWQTGERLNFRGDYYKLTLMSPFFNPGPIDHPDIPIYIAGVNTGLARLTGEIADGFLVHPFHSPKYLKAVILPAIEQGALKAGRSNGAISISVTAFTICDPGQRETVRQQIAFYASTPSYRPVMTLHGWDRAAEGLTALAARGKWGEMPEIITDEMLDVFATTAAPDELPAALKNRYQGMADRLSLYTPFSPGEASAFWENFVNTW